MPKRFGQTPSQDDERWEKLNLELLRLRDVDQENARLKVALARAEKRLRSYESAETQRPPVLLPLKPARPNGKPNGSSNGKAHG